MDRVCTTRRRKHGTRPYSKFDARPGDIVSWEPQVRIPLEGPGGVPLLAFESKRVVAYVADFIVTHLDGRREIHACKGYINARHPITQLWRLKLGLVCSMWPDTAFSSCSAVTIHYQRRRRACISRTQDKNE